MRYSKTAISLLAFLCGVFVAIPTAQAATITVTSESGGTGGPDCTLRDAITAANTDTAMGGCVAGNGADTIELPVDTTITLTEPDNNTDGLNGLPSITSEVIINGNGSTVERADGTPAFRIFFVASKGGLTLEHLTVSNGWWRFNGTEGGGIHSVGSLTLTDSTVSGNTAESGAGIFADGALTLIHSTVSGNFGATLGGGIFNEGVMVLTDSTVSNNEAQMFGGGIFNTGTAMVANTTFGENSAGFHGSGIGNGGTLTLTNSTISGNFGANAGGGGFWTRVGVLTLIQSTVCGNLPDQIDGIYTDGGGNLVTEECPPCTLGDLDGDGAVGPMDLAILLGSWGPCAGCPADVNDDGQVGPFDLATLLSVWGLCR